MYLKQNLTLTVLHRQVKKTVVAAAPVVAAEVASTDLEAASEPVVAQAKEAETTAPHPAAERMFNHMQQREEEEQQAQQQLLVQDEIDDVELEKTIEKAHRLEQDSQRIVATGEVWRALQENTDSQHNQDIHALLRASEEPEPHYNRILLMKCVLDLLHLKPLQNLR